MQTTITETSMTYNFTVMQGEYKFVYEWGKESYEGQTKEEYLLACKQEAELLATYEIEKLQPPTSIIL